MSTNDIDRKVAMNTELYEYKRKVISAMMSDEAIVEALDADVDASELIYDRIFPYGVVPDTQLEANCYITVEITMPQVSTVNYFFKDVLLVINVVCHNDIMKTEYGIPRHDYIAAKICELLNFSTDLGYGELQLVSNTEGAFSERHSGRTMRFKTSERSAVNGWC